MIRVSVMICFYFKAEIQAAFWKQTEKLLGAEGAWALEFSIWEQRSPALLVLLPPLHSQPHENLSFQVSATLLTIMRLLGRVEAAKYLAAVSKGFRNISWAILMIFPSPLLPSLPLLPPQILSKAEMQNLDTPVIWTWLLYVFVIAKQIIMTTLHAFYPN